MLRHWKMFGVLTGVSVILAHPVLAATAPATAPAASSGMAIAAIVGDQAITSYDVDSRIKFIVATAHISDSPDMLARVRPQVIRSLVDEKLELQEATKEHITVTQKDLDDAVASIEQQRGMPPGTINRMLEEDHVPKETFLQQIRAQLSWNRLLMQKIRPQVHVSDTEIAMAEKRKPAIAPPPVKKKIVPQELNIAVIALPVDKPSRERDVRRLSEKLVADMRRGASFEEIARQFSSATASAGGKVETFWIRPEQLDAAIARALEGAETGTLTNPVRTGEGYTIVKVFATRALEGAQAAKEEPRDLEINLKEMVLRLKAGSTAKDDAVLKASQELGKHAGNCEEKTMASLASQPDVEIEVNYRRQMLSELAPAMKTIAQGLSVGEVSTPFASKDGIRLYMMCSKGEPSGKPMDRDQIYSMLMQQKMELEAQKYLRNLRLGTFVDIR